MNLLQFAPRIFTFALLALLLSGCQSTPEQLHIEPVLNLPEQPTPVQLSVRDSRSHNHLLRRLHHEDKAEFATAQQPLATLISGNLASHWPDTPDAEAKVQIAIEQALIKVTRSGVQHNMQYELQLAATISTPQGELQKTFSGTAHGQSPLVPGQSRLERDFSMLAGQVLSDLMHDQDIQEWLGAPVAQATPTEHTSP